MTIYELSKRFENKVFYKNQNLYKNFRPVE